MSIKNDEKNLGGVVPASVADAFVKQAKKRGYITKRAIAAAFKLWIGLPEDVQARLMNQSLRSNLFLDLVQEVVDDRMKAGHAAGVETDS